MPQVRVMGDDLHHVEQVVTLLLHLINSAPALTAGDPTRLHHRGGGGRIVFDVNATTRPASAERPEQVRAERIDNQGARPPRRTPRRRALPPA
ncbi:hypothetical protein [Nonomuraea typhae]|uniref:hypothetical protein n=1 Tax=Nonomuraea typhae TaxID=2603600 RepID=UPI0012FCD334|nr:hypothetical protein [Nonomuraea typhae]